MLTGRISLVTIYPLINEFLLYMLPLLKYTEMRASVPVFFFNSLDNILQLKSTHIHHWAIASLQLDKKIVLSTDMIQFPHSDGFLLL